MAPRFVTSLKPASDASDISVLILGSELTPRRKGLGPKSLMQVGKRFNVIETQLDAIKTIYPNANVVLTTGYMSQQIINKCYDISIIENNFYTETSHIEDIRLGLNVIRSNKVIIIGGDVVFDMDALLTTKNKPSCLLFDDTNNIKDLVGITHNNNVAEILAYGLRSKWCNLAVLEGKELDILRKMVRNAERSKAMFFEAMNGIIASGGLLRTFQANGTIYSLESRLK